MQLIANSETTALQAGSGGRFLAAYGVMCSAAADALVATWATRAHDTTIRELCASVVKLFQGTPTTVTWTLPGQRLQP